MVWIRRYPPRLRALTCAFGVFALASFRALPARADSAEGFQWLPGDAREVSRASSASRDTAALEAILAPRFAVTLGTELGLLAWHSSGVTLRAGALALFGLESQTPSRRLFPAPGGDSNLWRGILSYELALSFDRAARQALGEHGALELTLGYYHESDHHTASNQVAVPGSLPDGPDLRGRPQIGNYLAADFAARLPFELVEVVLRHQSKLFENGTASANTPFLAGTGEECVVQVHGLSSGLTPFSATSTAVLIAKARSPVRYFRSLLGVSLPGVSGELRVYASYDDGAGQGLLITEHEQAFGAGLRYTPFRSRWP